VAGKAVEHAPNAGLPGLPHDGDHGVLRLPAVDHHGSPPLRPAGAAGLEPGELGLPGREVVVEVQAALAHRDDPGRARRARSRSRTSAPGRRSGGIRERAHLVGMDPGGGEDPDPRADADPSRRPAIAAASSRSEAMVITSRTPAGRRALEDRVPGPRRSARGSGDSGCR
jgi:hypothetical protein